MNTTSMEFVIAQEKTNKSPSVLSEFMGISKNMEDALLVNPWNLGVGVPPSPIPHVSDLPPLPTHKFGTNGCCVFVSFDNLYFGVLGSGSCNQQRASDVAGRKGG